MSLSVGEIRINLSAGTSAFVQDLEKANAKIHEFGERGVSEHKAIGAAAKVLEGNLFSNARAMDGFLEKLKLGGIAKAAFPVIGAVAFAGVITETGKKLVEFFKTLSEGPNKSAAEWGKLTQSINLSNASLETQAAKLRNEINHLLGHPQNGLAVALSEAREESIKLGESLEKNLEDIAKLLKDHQGNFLEFWKPDTSALSDKIQEILPQVFANTSKATNLIRNTDQKSPNAQTHINNIITTTQAENNRLLDDLIAQATDKLEQAKKDLAESVKSFRPGSLGAKMDQAKPRAEIVDTSTAIASLQATKQNQSDQLDVYHLSARKDQLAKAKEDNATFVEQLKQAYDLMEATQDAGETMLASEKLAFRQKELAEISQYGTQTKTLQKELALDIARLQTDANKEAIDAFDQQMKRGQEMREQDLEQQNLWAKRAIEIKELVNKTSNRPDTDAAGKELPDRTKAKPDELPGVVGDSARLQKANYPTVNQQQSGIDQQKAALEAMVKMNAPLTQQLDLREKILQAQIALAQSQGQSTQSDQLSLANLKAQQTLSQWNNIGAGTIGADVTNQLMQLPQELGSTLANAVFDHRKGDSAGKQFGQMFKGLGKELFGQIAGQLIEKLASEIAVHVFGIQIQSANTTALLQNTAALIASSGASGAGGAAGAAGGVAGGVASSAGSDASSLATGLMGPLVSALGGVVGGVISGFMSLHGDHEIVQAVQGTTAAVNALGTRLGGNGLTGTNLSNGTTSATSTTSSGFGSWAANTALSTLFGGGNAIPVSVVSISPIALGAGIFRMFGFADGGRPTPGQPTWIGERGKELWVPDRPGTVIPNHMAGDYLSGHNVTAANSTNSSYTSGNNTFHIHGATDPRAVTKAIADYMKASSPRFSPFSS